MPRNAAHDTSSTIRTSIRKHPIPSDTHSKSICKLNSTSRGRREDFSGVDIEREIADAQVRRISFDSDSDDDLAQIPRRDRMVGGADGRDSPDSSGDCSNPKDDCGDSRRDSEAVFDYGRVRTDITDTLANLGAGCHRNSYQIKAEAVDDL